jgi:hypothetical protein
MENEVKAGDIFQLDNNETIMIVEKQDGYHAAQIDATGVVVSDYIIDDAFLHSMRAVAVCNICSVLEEVKCL